MSVRSPVNLMNKFSASCVALGLVVCSLTASANDPYSTIIEHQNNGRYNEALTQISTILADNKDDFRALLLKGNVNKLMGNTDQAVSIFKELIEQYPQMPEPYNNLAVLYADTGQTALAVETLQQVFSTSHSYSAAFNNLRNLYNEMASSAYREALDIKQKKSKKNSQYTLLSDTVVASKVSEPATGNIIMAEQSNDLSKQIQEVIGSWSSAWSGRKIKDYFQHYHSEFVPPNSVGRKEWERVRGIRLSKPKYIQIEIVGVSVSKKSDDLVTAMFEQHYRSDTYKDTVVKVLTLKKQKDKWRILREDVL